MAVWRFTQLQNGGPKGPAKTLELDGPLAPHGRPRKGAVFKETIESRVQTTKYPGVSGSPNRAIFGTDWDETSIAGRWMTKHIANGTANDVADAWTAFIRDERTCRISWGNIVSYVGYVKKLELDRESENEIAYKITFLIDKRDEFTSAVSSFQIATIDKELENLGDFVSKLAAPRAELPDLQPDLLSAIDGVVSQINKISAEMNKLAGQIDDLEKGAFGVLRHLRAAVSGMMSAIIQLRETISNVGIDSQSLSRSIQNDVRTAGAIAGGLAFDLVGGNAQSDVAWLTYRNDVDADSIAILAILAELDRRIEQADTRDDVTRATEAKEGDTWESIALRAGGLNLVGKIRQLNGVKYGEKPVPGELYLLP